MEQELNTLQHYIAESLTTEEKSVLRSHVAYTIVQHPVRERMPFFQNVMHHGLSIMLSAFIFIVFVGGSVSVVADNALPGDPLYAFKVHVNEEVRGIFINSSAGKVAWQQTRIDTRLNEIKTLADSQTLTKEKQATVQQALDEHINDLSSELATSDPTTALQVTAAVASNLKQNEVSIVASVPTDTPSAQSQKDAAIQTVNNAIQAVSVQQVKIISKEVAGLATDAQNTPALSVPSNLGSTIENSSSSALSSPPTTTPTTP